MYWNRPLGCSRLVTFFGVRVRFGVELQLPRCTLLAFLNEFRKIYDLLLDLVEDAIELLQLPRAFFGLAFKLRNRI